MKPAIAPEPAIERTRTRDFVLWGVSLAFATKLGSVVLSLVLARLIAPELFGQYGTVSTILLFLMSFSMQRFTEHLFFQEDPTREEYHRHLSFGILLHLALLVVTNCIAAALQLHPTLSKVAVYLHIASLSILINIPRIIYVTHLRFELRWKTLRLLRVVSFLLYAVASITLAVQGFGVLGLLTQNLIVPLPYAVAFFFERRRLAGWNFDWRAHRGAFRFGLMRTASGILGTARQAAESLLFSLTIGYGPLGLFNRAKGLSLLSTAWLSDQLGMVLLPSLAKLQPRTDAARRAAGLLLRVGVWTSAPVAVTVAMVDHASVYVLFGDQWADVVPLVRPMLGAAIASSGLAVANLILLTSDGPRSALVLDVIVVGTNLTGLVVIAAAGAYGYAIYLAAANTMLFLGVFRVLIRERLLGFADVIRVFSPVAILAAIGLLAAGQDAYGEAELSHPFLTLALSAGGCAFCAMVLVRVIDPMGLRTISTVRGKLRQRTVSLYRSMYYGLFSPGTI